MIEFTVLGSGSGGNATLVRASDRRGIARSVLIDAGLGPRTTRTRLARLGIDANEIGAIVLTHVDTDHWRDSWVRTAITRDVRIHACALHAEVAARRGVPRSQFTAFDGAFTIGDLHFDPVRLPHDDLGTRGFRIERTDARSGRRATLGFATDLGRATDELLAHLDGVDALALESNYDHEMQVASPRPIFLKRRIMDGRGHLSNDECVDTAIRLARTRTPEHVVLLHLSRECNCPERVGELWRRRAPHLSARVVVSRHDEPTPLLRVEGVSDARAAFDGTATGTATQSTLFDGA